MAVDRNHDGKLTIDELIPAVNSALDGCGATPTPTFAQAMLITGGCSVPGPSRLKPCAAGTRIVVWRCDATAACIQHVESRTRLGDGSVGASGGVGVSVAAVALGAPGVEQALVPYQFPATPPAPRTATATIPASAPATRTSSPPATATLTRTAAATATPTASPPATATRTRTGSATATSTAS